MESQMFVAREAELAQLDKFLRQALESHGTTCFITGEAGSGKTTLVSEFARRAQEKYADLAVAVGQSDAQTGVGDAHLPFREVLGQLTGDVETKLAQGEITQENAGRLRKLLVLSGQALVDLGPDLIGAFLPGIGLATRMGTFVAEKAGWLQKLEQLSRKEHPDGEASSQRIEQSHIYEQYANVLCRLSENQPLLVVVDDLQWADEASIGLLFRLARRIGNHRILIIGTYRPEEVSIGRAGERHPLEKVLAELKRYYGDIRVDLDQTEQLERRGFVNAILDSEPNNLGKDFRQKLYQQTGGHPLFTIELLRFLQESGNLVRDEQGNWAVTPGLAWGTVPDRVEGVIEERIGRLEVELHRILAVGSVEGEDFTAEVVSRVLSADVRTEIQKLSSELDKQHRLVKANGVKRLQLSGQRLSQYRFQHNLIRTYLYAELDETQRVYLHEDVGNILEELYNGQVDEILVQLASHYDRAGIVEKAVHYLRLAGDQAARRFANAEAARYYSRALALTPDVDTLTGRPEQLADRYRLHLAREEVYAWMGERKSQRLDLDALCRLAEDLGDDARRAEVSLREARYSENIGDYPAALAVLGEALQAAELVGDIPQQARALRALGYILWRKGDFKESRAQSENALILARSVALQEVEASALHNLAVSHWRLGELDKARSFGQQCLVLSRAIDDRHTVSSALSILGNIELGLGEYAAASSYYEECLQNDSEIGNRRGQAMAQGNIGIVAEIQGDFPSAMERFRKVGEIFNEIGDRGSEARSRAHLGLNASLHGDYVHGRASYETALQMYREIGDRQGQVWVQTTFCRLLIQVGELVLAEMHIREALKLAEEMGANIMEAGARMVLARVQEENGQLEDAAAGYLAGLDFHRESGNEGDVISALAGLARVELAQGNTESARLRAKEIWRFAQKEPIQGTADDPLEIYLTCYRVFSAVQDAGAGDVLLESHRLLLQQAARISDPTMRCSYLENVPSNREILQEFAREH